jgi:hypothetical protein
MRTALRDIAAVDPAEENPRMSRMGMFRLANSVMDQVDKLEVIGRQQTADPSLFYHTDANPPGPSGCLEQVKAEDLIESFYASFTRDIPRALIHNWMQQFVFVARIPKSERPEYHPVGVNGDE